MKEKTTIHIWLLLLLSLAALAGAGWYAHAKSPAIEGLMPVLGDAYGPVTQTLGQLTGSEITEVQSSSSSAQPQSVAVTTDTPASRGNNAGPENVGSENVGSEAVEPETDRSAGVDSENNTVTTPNTGTNDQNITGATADGSSDTSSPDNSMSASLQNGEANQSDGTANGTGGGAGNRATSVQVGENTSGIGIEAVTKSGDNAPVVGGLSDAVSANADDAATNNEQASQTVTDTVVDDAAMSADASTDTTDQTGSVNNAEAVSGTEVGDGNTVQRSAADDVLATLRETELGLLQNYAKNIEFESERWALNERSRDALASVFETLFIYSDVNLQLDVYVFDTDDSALNQVISEQRASAVLGYLTDRGLESDRVEVAGRGDAPLSNDAGNNPPVSRVMLLQLDGDNE